MNIYKIVTDRIIAELEKGIIPWRRPWAGVRDGTYSRATGRPYSLLNQFLLGKPGEWLTYRQAQEAGGQVRKGEKGSIVVFWKMDGKAEKDADTGELRIKQFPILRYYNVFHVDQCDGIEPKHKEAVFRCYASTHFFVGGLQKGAYLIYVLHHNIMLPQRWHVSNH